MSDNLSFALLCFTSFFTLINPLGSMPIFMSMTTTLSEKERNNTARKAAIAALITLLAFAFTGHLLFSFFGISIHSFRVVGGIIFFVMGMDMLQARIGHVKIKEEEVKAYVSDISITPLAIPMICGPGAITNSIVLMQDANSLMKKSILIASIVIIIGITYLVYYSSSRLFRVIGQTGINVMMRLMGLIVMVIAVEFFLSGLRPIVAGFLQN